MVRSRDDLRVRHTFALHAVQCTQQSATVEVASLGTSHAIANFAWIRKVEILKHGINTTPIICQPSNGRLQRIVLLSAMKRRSSNRCHRFPWFNAPLQCRLASIPLFAREVPQAVQENIGTWPKDSRQTSKTVRQAWLDLLYDGWQFSHCPLTRYRERS